MTVDYMFALISTEELQDANQMMFKQLKNRYGDPTKHSRFVVGVDKSRMRLYNVENPDGTSDDIPMFDKTDYGQSEKIYHKFDISKFEGFK
jgi:hypothetical protein